MNNLKPMICPCCNAPLHSHICEYCGVEFEGYEKKEEENKCSLEVYINEDGFLERKYYNEKLKRVINTVKGKDGIWYDKEYFMRWNRVELDCPF